MEFRDADKALLAMELLIKAPAIPATRNTRRSIADRKIASAIETEWPCTCR
jgi:hypothetical protein